MNTHNIIISFENGRPYVDLPELFVKPNDRIEWKSFDRETFTLYFGDGTPFEPKGKNMIRSEKDSVNRTVANAKSGEKVPRKYKYFVIFHDEMLDPVIIVDN